MAAAIDAQFIKSFMRLNGLGADATPTEVRRAFSRARWPDEEVERAISIIFGGSRKANNRAAGVNAGNVKPNYNSSASHELSELLGVDVVIDPSEFRLSQIGGDRVKATLKQLGLILLILIISLGIAGGVGYGLMYYFKIGPFFGV